MRELQSVLNMLPALIKALPIFAAYLIVLKFTIASVKSWRAPVSYMELGAGLAGLAAFLYVLGK